MTSPTTDPDTGAGPWPDPGSGPGHTGRRAQARRPVTFGRLLAMLLVGTVAAGCGAGPGPSGDRGPAAATPASTASSGPNAVSPSGRLGAALARLQPGYRFETTISVNGRVAARARGRSTGSGSEMTLEAGSATITYRMLPPRSWVRQDDGAWLEADGAVPGGDPLAELRAPIRVEALPGSDAESRLRATYPPGTFGSSEDLPVEVTLMLAADGSISVAYAAPVGDAEGSAVAILTPDPDQPAIVEPSISPGA